MKQLTLILSFLILASITSIAQRPADKFENKIFHFENDSIKYRLFVPEDYLSFEPLPLILTLHGLAECGSDNNQHIITHRIAETWAEDSSQQKNAAYIISPQIPKRSNSLDDLLEYLTIYWFSGVDALLDSMIIKYPIDTARIYLTGLSLGAINTWWLIYNHSPNRFAAAIPISGGWLGEWLPQNMEPQISEIPVWAFCGSNDYEWDMIHKVRNMVSNIENEGYNVIRKLTNYGDVGLTRNEIDSLNAEGIKHIYTEFTDGSHENVYDLTYDDPNLHHWLFSQVKPITTQLDENWIVYKTSNSGLPSNSINCLSIDKDDNKWIGTNNGLVKFDGAKWEVYDTLNSDIPNNFVSCMAIDRFNNKWIGTFGSLAKYDGTNWVVYDSTNSEMPLVDYYGEIVIDHDDNKWFADVRTKDYGKLGLVKFDNSSWTVYDTLNSGLPSNNVYCIEVDEDNNKWIGTAVYAWGPGSGKGLVKFNDTT